MRTVQDDVVIFFSHASATAQNALKERGVRLVQIPRDNEGMLLGEVLLSLRAMQITNLMIEGGAKLYTSALNHEIVDKLMLFYAPKFLGPGGLPMVGSVQGLATVQRSLLRKFGDDFAFEAYLRDPWKDVPSSEKP